MARRRREPDGQRKQTAEEFAQALPDEYLHCRVWQHHWEPTGHAEETGRNRAGQDAHCLICGTEKTLDIRVLRARAKVRSNKYRYPAEPPYTGKNVEAGLTRDVFRFEYMQREQAQAPGEDAAETG